MIYVVERTVRLVRTPQQSEVFVRGKRIMEGHPYYDAAKKEFDAKSGLISAVDEPAQAELLEPVFADETEEVQSAGAGRKKK